MIADFTKSILAREVRVTTGRYGCIDDIVKMLLQFEKRPADMTRGDSGCQQRSA